MSCHFRIPNRVCYLGLCAIFVATRLGCVTEPIIAYFSEAATQYSKTETPVEEVLVCFGCVNEIGSARCVCSTFFRTDQC